MLFLNGVYVTDGSDPPAFRHVADPERNEQHVLVEQIASRIGRVLELRAAITPAHRRAGAPQSTDTAPRGDELGQAALARIWHSDRDLRRLR